MRFAKFDLAKEVKDALVKMNYHKTTDIQFRAITPILKGEDVLAIAQTGTGKTAAFAIPIINKIHFLKMQSKIRGVQCLIMVPTRELAQQITAVCNDIAQFTKVKTYALIGGVEQDPQISKLQLGVDILVSTPGRMFDLIHQGHLELNNVHTLILDEADLMLDLGFNKDIQDVLRFLSPNRQTLFFSATIDNKIKKLAYSIVTKAIRIELSPKDPVSKNIDHWKININQDDKRFFLERLIKENPGEKILVFVRTRVRSERVQKAMQRAGIETVVMNGEMDQNERQKTLKTFREEEGTILIATDVSARGIDIPNVSIVVNYDLPEDPAYYVHRIGRTGRGRNKGVAYAFVNEDEGDLLQEIESYVKKPINEMLLDDSFYKEILKVPDEENIGMKDIMDLIDENEVRNLNKKKKFKK